LVFPAKYRKKIFDDVVDKKIRNICIEISKRYEINIPDIPHLILSKNIIFKIP
jgi:REP element-mobilizing transposase RayT